MGPGKTSVPLRYRQLTWDILGACIEVHRVLGPGLVESAYCKCLEIELRTRGLPFLKEVQVAIPYKGETIENAFRADFIIDRKVVLEIKSLSALDPVHEAQILTYLKLTGLEIGLLINFNVPALRQGVRRMIKARADVSGHNSPDLRVIS
jgi:GxxExxY protein